MITYNSRPMKVLGIITEYNPLHKGHLFHLSQSKEVTGAEIVIAIMSGHFVQRGEPALCNKWLRAEWALKSGVDVVIELPTLFATASAEHFAYGSVALLDALGCVDAICFGSETGSLIPLEAQAKWQYTHGDLIKQAVLNDKSASFSRVRDTLSPLPINGSNDILGVAYLMALYRLNSSIQPYTIQRVHNNYRQTEITHEIASATAIRQHLKESRVDRGNILSTLSPIAAPYFSKDYSGDIDPERWSVLMLSSLRRMTVDELNKIHDLPEGYSHKIKKACMQSTTVQELVEKLQAKHLTNSRIQRILLKALLNIQKIDLQPDCLTQPEYIRILGFTQLGKTFLSQCSPTLPVITNIGKSGILNQTPSSRQLEIDLLATALYALGSPFNAVTPLDDYKRPPIQV